MRSNTSAVPARSRRRARIAIAGAAAGLAIAGVAAASGTAFADTGCAGSACSTYTGTVIVTSSISLFPSSGTFGTLTVNPDNVQHTIPGFRLSVQSTDSAGAALTVALPTPVGGLADTDFSSDTWADNGGWTDTPVHFDAAGDPIPVYTLGAGGLTGHSGNPCPAGALDSFSGGVCSSINGNTIGGQPVPLGSDVLQLGLYIQVPSSQPGSPASGFPASFSYSLIGNLQVIAVM